MMVALLVPILSALTTAPGTPPPATPVPVPPSEAEALHDIAPPLDIFPYPPWMVALAALAALALLGFLVWALVRWLRNRPAPPPIPPSRIAAMELEKLRLRAGEMEPYAFSIAVSDVLRTFIGKAKFRLPATRQTSPELLAAVSQFFNDADRRLLGRFLEKCDMIKFARIHATSADNRELVESALTFVRGGSE